MGECHASVLWRGLDSPSTEYCALWSTDDGWEVCGTLCSVLHEEPSLVTYTVRCNSRWETSAVDVLQETGASRRELHLLVDGERRWWQADLELVALRGCIDVDLEITPATNTLPIRRAAPSIGAAIPVRAAWIRFPTLHVELLEQRYTRLQDRTYRYESLESGFSADLTVDAAGLVVRYAALWERVTAHFL